MEERELAPRGGEGIALWVALGCGGLALIGLCLVPPALVLWGWQADDVADEGDDPQPVVVAPAPPALTPITPPPAPDPFGVPRPAVPPPPGMERPRQVTVRITEAHGVSGILPGASCTFPVTRHPRQDGTFWCRAEITCGGRLLYGGGTAGYFDCTLYEQPQRHVVGQDFDTTEGDGDAAMRLDTLRAELEVRDDARGALGAFRVVAQVTAVE